MNDLSDIYDWIIKETDMCLLKFLEPYGIDFNNVEQLIKDDVLVIHKYYNRDSFNTYYRIILDGVDIYCLKRIVNFAQEENGFKATVTFENC